jgi:hypothetical protein
VSDFSAKSTAHKAAH